MSCIYKGNFKSKQIKLNKLCNLKDFWKENKEILSKEINELKESLKNPLGLQKTLGVEQADEKNSNKCDKCYQDFSLNLIMPYSGQIWE